MPLSDNKYLVQMMLGIRVAIVMICNLLLTKVLFSNLNEDQFRSFIILVSASGILAIVVQNSTLTSYRIYTSIGTLEHKGERVFASQKRLLFLLVFLSTFIFIYFGLYNLNIFRLLPLFLFPILVQFVLAPEITKILIAENLNRYFLFLTIEPLLRILIIGVISISNIKINLYLVALVYFVVSILVMSAYICSGKIDYFKRNLFSKYQDQITIEDFAFSKWILLGLLASIVNTHLLTFWFDSNYNSTIVSFRGVATQVFAALVSLGSSSFVVLKKDIMLTLSTSGKQRDLELALFRSTRIQLIIMIIPSLIILLNVDYILKLWLDNNNRILLEMTRWSVISAFIFNLHQPITAAFHASKHTKLYTLFTDIFLLLSLGLYFLLGVLGFGVISVYKLQVALLVTAQLIRLGVGYYKNLLTKNYLFENGVLVILFLVLSFLII